MVIVKTETLHFFLCYTYFIIIMFCYLLFFAFASAFYVDFDQFSLLQLLFAAELNAPHCAAALALPALSRRTHNNRWQHCSRQRSISCFCDKVQQQQTKKKKQRKILC